MPVSNGLAHGDDIGNSPFTFEAPEVIPDPTKAFNQIKVDFVNDYGGATSLEFPLSGKP